MKPKDMTYDICRHYIADHYDVDHNLLNLVSGYARARRYDELSTCSRHFDWHRHTIKEWRFLRQIEAFFKKNSTFAEKERCKSAAQASFVENEEQCSRTNLRLQRIMYGNTPIEFKYRAWIAGAQRFIQSVLGDASSFIDVLPTLVKVTSGATSHANRQNSIPQLKMRLKLFATRRARPYLFAIYKTFGFDGVRFSNCKSNRVELVPKNWKTDRTIACEPEGNLPLQLAFDTYAKRKLKRFGIDLSNQSANKVSARQASIDGYNCTIDMKAASDTISYNTVCLLFPDRWFKFLCDVRTPLYRGVFGNGVYSKFSSMGNGSTFCIETLIFAAVCKAVGSKRFLVYGDDVIIESRLYNDFVDFARFLGFTVNEEKSFATGNFRESCGGDYFNGVDVTPVYIRSIDRRKANLCHLVNTMRELSYPGSKLDMYLDYIISEYELPSVPKNESTTSGVWIDPVEARRQGILRRFRIRKDGPVLDYYKAYVPKNKRRNFTDIRGYYLWFLNKRQQVSYPIPWSARSAPSPSPTQTSSVPIFQHAYVRKWVNW